MQKAVVRFGKLVKLAGFWKATISVWPEPRQYRGYATKVSITSLYTASSTTSFFFRQKK